MIFYNALKSQTIMNKAEPQEHTQLSDLDSRSSRSMDDFYSIKATASKQRLREGGKSGDLSR
jgi:hypothetical protein